MPTQEIQSHPKQTRLAIDILMKAYLAKEATALYDAIEAARGAGEEALVYQEQLLILDPTLRYNRADNGSDEEALLSLIKQYIAQYAAQKNRESRLVLQYQEALKAPQTAFQALQDKLKDKIAFATAEVIHDRQLEECYMPEAIRPEGYRAGRGNALVQLKKNHGKNDESRIDLIKVTGIALDLNTVARTINEGKGPFGALVLKSGDKTYHLRAQVEGNRIKFQKVPADNPQAKPSYISLAESQSGWNTQVANVFAQLAKDMNHYNVFTAGFEGQAEEAEISTEAGMSMEAAQDKKKTLKMD